MQGRKHLGRIFADLLRANPIEAANGFVGVRNAGAAVRKQLKLEHQPRHLTGDFLETVQGILAGLLGLLAFNNLLRQLHGA